jgi:hypothetical protein
MKHASANCTHNCHLSPNRMVNMKKTSESDCQNIFFIGFTLIVGFGLLKRIGHTTYGSQQVCGELTIVKLLKKQCMSLAIQLFLPFLLCFFFFFSFSHNTFLQTPPPPPPIFHLEEIINCGILEPELGKSTMSYRLSAYVQPHDADFWCH